ncbi:helicase-related protein [Chlamydiia bacterium]|nr:helicase-related protein [Chlamydiia bacterium]
MSWIEPLLSDLPDLYQSDRYVHTNNRLITLLLTLKQQSQQHHVIWVCPSQTIEADLFSQFESISTNGVTTLPCSIADASTGEQNDMAGIRLSTLDKLQQAQDPQICITSIQGLLQKSVVPVNLESSSITYNVGDTISLAKVKNRLLEAGYDAVFNVMEKGQFSIRNNIIDIFPINRLSPVRIDTWGDEIDSIATFDTKSQRSIDQIKQVRILSRDNQNTSGSVLSYLTDAILILDDPETLENQLVDIDRGTCFYSLTELLAKNQKVSFFSKILARDFDNNAKRIDKHHYDLHFYNTVRTYELYHPVLESVSQRLSDSHNDWNTDIQAFLQQGYNVTMTFPTDAEKNHVMDMLSKAVLKQIDWQKAYVTDSVISEVNSSIVIPTYAITHKQRLHRPALREQHRQTQTRHNIEDTYKPGDYVVHIDHGIGKFIDIETKVINDITKEYYILEYANKSRLYVPIDHIHLITPYVGFDSEHLPECHELGSKSWVKAKKKTQVNVDKYARDLVSLYAKRKATVQDRTRSKDNESISSFNNDFPYILTTDQLRAWDDIQKDIDSLHPMDRLLCADVGYGKTEVAMRAAFKTVVEYGGQVIFLVPTTVLALQHADTLKDRFVNFPVSIELLSRLSKKSDVDRIQNGISNGSIDIVVATQKVLNNDFAFKQLSLLIIDEEQSFGVKVKEHFSMYKTKIDVLSLSATPIPRTLYMSMLGTKAMSRIDTPPVDRQPIVTIVQPRNWSSIETVIKREFARGGQVFFVHNNTTRLPQIATHLQERFPHKSIGVVHGQMKKNDIEKAFIQFKSHETDILVATTIIEKGIDIANANTIIIDRAEHFGLSDLHQLRGRVGRWNRRAYAYLVTDPNKSLPPDATKRLETLKASSSFGGGIRIAMRDLEIRGCGEILGTQQSGHIASVGFKLYCKLLEKTMKTLETGKQQTAIDVKLSIPVDAYIPTRYIRDTESRLAIYHQFVSIKTVADADKILEQIKEQHGPYPDEVNALAGVSKIKCVAKQQNISGISVSKRHRDMLAITKDNKTIQKRIKTMSLHEILSVIS